MYFDSTKDIVDLFHERLDQYKFLEFAKTGQTFNPEHWKDVATTELIHHEVRSKKNPDIFFRILLFRNFLSPELLKRAQRKLDIWLFQQGEKGKKGCLHSCCQQAWYTIGYSICCGNSWSLYLIRWC
jgi:hypothetical protein